MTTWMVVEDEPDLFNVVLAMYAMIGVDGVAFSNGEEAANWIDDVDSGRSTAEIPEMALLDIRLPGDISGPMIGQRLRQSPNFRDIAIVVMTAYKLSPREEQAVITQSGCDLLIYKPLPRPRDFRDQIHAILGRSPEAPV